MNIVIVKYPGGNVQSVAFSLERLGVSATVTDNPERITGADRVILPGVGEASTAMRHLRLNRLDEVIRSLRQPVLGICLGMQLMCRYSEENNTECMGLFDVDVVRFSGKTGKVPHMGWNSLHDTKDWLGDGVEGNFAYFVHSYFVPVNVFTVATTHYGQAFSAALRRDNFHAVQFHPEKSGEAGSRILSSFLTQPAAL